MGGVTAVGVFLYSLVFSLVVFFLWARIALRYFKISRLQPISHTIYQLTDPVVLPVSKLLGFNRTHSTPYDWGAFVVLIFVEFCKYCLAGLLFAGTLLPVAYVFLATVADLIIQPCNLLFYAIIIQVVMSWINPGWRHPVAEVLYAITEPLLRLGRRVVPVVSGIDFSPLVVIIVLKIVTIFVEGYMPFRI